MNMVKKAKSWLLPAVLILFLLEVILLPFVAGYTYAGRAESPDHILTYTTRKLTWDSATGIAPNGTAIMSLFQSSYQNVQSDQGDKVVAPGTETENIIRLKNSVSRKIEYVAVLYSIKEEPALPVVPVLSGSGFADTTNYSLPNGVSRSQVLRAVTGTLDGGKIQDFDISWNWNYFDSDARDQVDTALGNRAAWDQPDDVTVGLYIVVMDEGEKVTSEIPKTGDSNGIYLYFALMAVSAVLLVLLLLERRKESKWETS